MPRFNVVGHCSESACVVFVLPAASEGPAHVIKRVQSRTDPYRTFFIHSTLHRIVTILLAFSSLDDELLAIFGIVNQNTGDNRHTII
jgi:hypothetical protein